MASQLHGAARRSSARRTAVAYASAFFLLVAAFVRFYEELLLESAYRTEYRAYKRAVRAWWPRLHPWEPSSASALR